MAEPLKHAFGADLVDRIATAAARTHRSFDRGGFVATATAPLDDLELKDRVNHMADTLRAHLPERWTTALPHVVAIAHEIGADDTEAFGDMAAWPSLPMDHVRPPHNPRGSCTARRCSSSSRKPRPRSPQASPGTTSSWGSPASAAACTSGETRASARRWGPARGAGEPPPIPASSSPASSSSPRAAAASRATPCWGSAGPATKPGRTGSW